MEIYNTGVYGWESAIRGMRNPLNSHHKSDSEYVPWGFISAFQVGEKDLELMKKLVKAGTDHSKFMRMITVTCDIEAPILWWKEMDTYKVGTVRNSCSTMHKICSEPITLDNFEIIYGDLEIFYGSDRTMYDWMEQVVGECEYLRQQYLETKDKRYWQCLIDLLPESYIQRATWQANYQVLRNIYHSRRNHKLPQWHEFCDWIESLPCSELITGGVADENE